MLFAFQAIVDSGAIKNEITLSVLYSLLGEASTVAILR